MEKGKLGNARSLPPLKKNALISNCGRSVDLESKNTHTKIRNRKNFDVKTFAKNYRKTHDACKKEKIQRLHSNRVRHSPKSSPQGRN